MYAFDMNKHTAYLRAFTVVRMRASPMVHMWSD